MTLSVLLNESGTLRPGAAELIEELIPPEAVRISITRVKGMEGNAREITIENGFSA